MSQLIKAMQEYHYLRVLLIGRMDQAERQELRQQLGAAERKLIDLRTEYQERGMPLRGNLPTQQGRGGASGGAQRQGTVHLPPAAQGGDADGELSHDASDS